MSSLALGKPRLHPNTKINTSQPKSVLISAKNKGGGVTAAMIIHPQVKEGKVQTIEQLQLDIDQAALEIKAKFIALGLSNDS